MPIQKSLFSFATFFQKITDEGMRDDKWTNFQYWMVYGFSHLVSLLPFWLLYRISDVLFFFVYYVVRYRRGVVRENLAGSFPEKTKKEREDIGRKFYHFFCDYIFETLKLTSISRKSMRKHISFRGLEQLESAFRDEGHPFVFIYWDITATGNGLLPCRGSFLLPSIAGKFTILSIIKPWIVFS